jgi:RNA polymerase sigma-70 factor, ECF subfamily
LVRRSLAGDTQSFTQLVERHRQRVYNVCLRLLGDADDAADAAQDTFVAVLTKLHQFRGDAAFTTWVHRIALNACYDLTRKRRRTPMLRLAPEPGEASDEAAGPPVPDPADEVVGTHDVVAALRAIPEEFRVAVVLADLQDLAYEEVAKVLDVPIGTVKSRVHRGRVALARAMGLAAREPEATATASQEQADERAEQRAKERAKDRE